MKLTRESILESTVDVAEVKIKDLREFVKEEGITCPIKNGTSMVDGLNKICAVLDPEGETQPPAQEPVHVDPEPTCIAPLEDTSPPAEPTAPPEQKPQTEPPAKKQPPFLERRQAKIDAEKKACGSGDGGRGINPDDYGGYDKMPAFLQRKVNREVV